MLEAEVIDLVHPGRRDEALESILRAYKRKVFGLALSYLRNREAAEDVAQEVFIKVWKALPRFDGRATISTWIYTITRNTSFSAIRAQRPSSSLSDPDVLAAVEMSAPARWRQVPNWMAPRFSGLSINCPRSNARWSCSSIWRSSPTRRWRKCSPCRSAP